MWTKDKKDIVSCKQYAQIVKEYLKKEVEGMDGRKPSLLIIQVGNNQASNSYVKGKLKDCQEVGIEVYHMQIAEDMPQEYVIDTIKLKRNQHDGIIVQLPLPKHMNPDEISNAIPMEKDVDGFRPDSKFNCCTPRGIVDWLEYNKYPIEGSDIVVVGRSKIVGKPLANMLIDKGATVTVCNSHTEYIYTYTSSANIVISAIGNPKYFDYADFCEADIIIDVGINRDENGKLCGDIDKESCNKFRDEIYVTPVPGGVGLLTRVALLQNVIESRKLNGQDHQKI